MRRCRESRKGDDDPLIDMALAGNDEVRNPFQTLPPPGVEFDGFSRRRPGEVDLRFGALEAEGEPRLALPSPAAEPGGRTVADARDSVIRYLAQRPD